MRVLKVVGNGRVDAKPDIAVLSFTVRARAEQYGDCVAELNSRTEELRRSMELSGLERADLKTSDFSVDTDTKYEDGESVFVGYTASHRMRIELPMDRDLLNTALQKVAESESEAEIQIQFSVKDNDTLRKRVIAKAVEAAKENAAILAGAAGVKLGKLEQIDYSYVGVHIYEHSSEMVCGSAVEGKRYDADIEPEDVTASDSVTLIYEIVE